VATEAIRAFVAGEVPPEIRGRIYAGFQDARADFPDLRWVPAENLHLTVKFLGNIAATRIDEMARAIGHACELHSPFLLVLAGAGVFPPRGLPRVLWVGTAGGAGELEALAGDVDRRLSKRGVERERRPFSAHLTVARAGRIAQIPDLRPLVGSMGHVQWGEFRLQSLAFMRSHLGPEGARYERLAEIPLGDGAD
jgi:2'-5' RNA ligase